MNFVWNTSALGAVENFKKSPDPHWLKFEILLTPNQRRHHPPLATVIEQIACSTIESCQNCCRYNGKKQIGCHFYSTIKQ
ncbi:hypothetical protein T05_10157 [Trichinella murrelli]|uniref:Uncharacterized protein n=1 Tax=Trichinella murrelli TaxID=144512 RepID=A0A0V0TYS1_9BILA|nr:hypothetical protein T05_10157 [Trichinella murrelli]